MKRECHKEDLGIDGRMEITEIEYGGGKFLE
jgi:hypothetical protein